MPVWVLPASSLIAIVLLLSAPSWRSAAWHARVPTLFAVVGIVALDGPEQVRQMIAGTEGPVHLGLFAAAVFATGIGCWFWARWSLNLAGAGGRAGVVDWEDQRGWVWLPRLVALAPAVGALIAIFQGWAWLTFWTGVWLVVSTVVVGAILVGVAWGRRRRVLQRRGGNASRRSWVSHWFLHDEFVDQALPPGRPLGDWLSLAVRCLPFHPALVAGMAGLSVVLALTVMSGYGPVVAVTQGLGPVPTALFGLAGLLTLLAPPVAFFASARRWPGLLVLALWVVGSAALSVNTAVVAPTPYPLRRPTLDQAAEAWLQRCARPEHGQLRVMLVGAAGGASRAALWAGAVMQALEQTLPLDPAHQLFAVSGVSGGALGVTGYVALLNQAGDVCGAAPATDAEARGVRLQKALGQDFLSPALGGLFFADAWWRVLGPVSVALRSVGVVSMERTGWLQRAWDQAFHGALTPTLVDQSFDGPVPRLPLLFTSGTHLETGRLVVTTPVTGVEGAGCVEVAGSAVPGAIDALQVLCADPSLAVVVSNSARFPYVTAPGLMVDRVTHEERGQVVDGGYFDNLGSTALQAAAEALKRAHTRLSAPGGTLERVSLRLFLVQVWSDPERAAVPRCEKAVPDVAVQPTAPTALDFLLSPLGALAGVRSERSSAGGAAMATRYCPAPDAYYAAFTMGPDSGGLLAPLNWVLPDRVRRSIAAPGLTGFPGAGNEQALKDLTAHWREGEPVHQVSATPP